MAKLMIELDKCTGCGLCIGSCPLSALSMQDKKAVVDADSCSLCGVCKDNCQFNAIFIDRDNCRFDTIFINEDNNEDNYGQIDASKYKDIWVFCEQRDGDVLNTGYELIGEARRLSGKRGCGVVALLFGEGVADKAALLIAAGADEVLVCDAPVFASNLDEPYAALITDLIEKRRPEILLLGATVFGCSLAPRIAARVKTGLTADCTALSIDDEKGLLLQIRPAFGGNLMAAIMTEHFRPQMATVRPGIMLRLGSDPRRKGVITQIPPPVGTFDAVRLLATIRTEPTASIADAKIIIAAGKGIGRIKNMALVHELADLLGGAVGCSRAVVDIGWAEYRHQIGQTGLAVSPNLLITCGISGSIQFLAGIGGAKKIIAINTDPDAPIFDVAHYRVIGNCIEILNMLISEVKKRKLAQNK